MKIKNKTSSNKKIATIIIVMLILACVGTVLVYAHNGGWSKSNGTSKTINHNPATKQQKSAGEQTKQNIMDANQGKTTQNDTPPQPTPIPNSTKKSVGMLITASSQNGSVYQIRTQIDTPTDDGTCTLTLTQGSKTVTKSAGVQALAKISSCKGFDIPTSELAPGTWQLSVNYNSDTLVGGTTSSISVQ